MMPECVSSVTYLNTHRLSRNFTFFTVSLLFFFLVTPHTTLTVNTSTQEDFMLFITESNADNSLMVALNHSLDANVDIIDIKTSEDLSRLFAEQNLFSSYSQIVMILNQVSSPLNETIVDNLATFVEEGGIFGIISSQIWKFPASFHTLLGISVSTGQKEWPRGNITGNITLTIVNDTFTNYPFVFDQNTSLEVQGIMGITDPLEESLRIATSQNTPDGNATVTGFQKGVGFLFAVPVSPIDSNFSSSLFSRLITSIIISGIDLQENSQTQTQTQEETTHYSEPPLLPLLNISEETVQTGIIIISVTFIILGLAYMISKWAAQPKEYVIPKDRDWFSIIILSPLLLIGHIVYPPAVRRLDEYQVLENEYRQKIIDILEEKDFMHFREIKRELDVGTSSLRWHLQVLEDFEIIKRKIHGQYEIFYLVRNTPQPEFLELYFAIISGIGFRVAKAFQEMNSWDLNALEDYLGYSKEAIRYHTKKFQKIQLLDLVEDRYYLNSTKLKMLMDAIQRRSKTN